jgi:dTMP kinase
MKEKNSFFITIEGVEGCGKTTQAKLLAAYLRKKGFKVSLTREPGGTKIGNTIRKILLNPKNREMDRYAELFLYLAARAQHLEEIILPKLKENTIIICDRFSDATRVYQGHSRGIPQSFIRALHSEAHLALKPDLTILLDMKEKYGLKRAKTRNQQGSLSSREGRFENESQDFHRRVRQGYLKIAKKEKKRVKVVDASASIEKVHGEIIQIIDHLLRIEHSEI